MNAENNRFQILSLSGGGIKGLYTAEVLKHLEKNYSSKRIVDHFDLICGTSIGGIIALALAYGHSPKDLAELLRKNGEVIFPKQNSVIAFCKQAFSSKHKVQPLKKLLTEIFEDATIKDLQKPVLIPTINATTGQARIFKNRYCQEYHRDQDIRLVDVALATSAAPGFLPAHEINSALYIDGGLVANSPILMGVHEARYKLDIKKQNIHVLSVGTMSSEYTLSNDPEKGSSYVKDWKMGANLFELTIAANEKVHNFMVTNSLGASNVLFIDKPPAREQASKLTLDNASPAALNTLIACADQSTADIADPKSVDGNKIRNIFNHTAQCILIAN